MIPQKYKNNCVVFCETVIDVHAGQFAMEGRKYTFRDVNKELVGPQVIVMVAKPKPESKPEAKPITPATAAAPSKPTAPPTLHWYLAAKNDVDAAEQAKKRAATMKDGKIVSVAAMKKGERKPNAAVTHLAVISHS